MKLILKTCIAALVMLPISRSAFAQSPYGSQNDSSTSSDQHRNRPVLSPSTGSLPAAPIDIQNIGTSDESGDNTESQNAASAGETTANSLSADRLIEILRSNPGLLLQVKQEALKMLQEQGNPIPENELTNSVLFDQIKTSARLRVALTAELKARGFLTRYDLEALQQEAPQPQLQMRPKKNAEQEPPAAVQKEEPNQPDASQLPSPYKGLPSLDDLYAQFPSQEAPIHRFGSDLFQTANKVEGGNISNGSPSDVEGLSAAGVNNNNGLPIDLPVGPDYVLGPGDDIDINMWGSVSQRIHRVVDPAGQIDLPESGMVMLAGRTLAEAEKSITSILSRQFKNVRVDVSLKRLRSVRIYVVGDVEHPGPYDISSLSTPLNALIVAGGPTVRGSLRTVRHYRGEKLVNEIDLYDFLLKGVRSAVERLEPGDTILVPPVGEQVTVIGLVKRSAIYELKNEAGLNDALDLAGGVLASGTLHQIKVERIEAHEKRIMLNFKAADVHDKSTLDSSLAKFKLQDGDRVTISAILPYNERTVYLQGHVVHPGKFPYWEGMSVTDLIHSYRDLLPEPSDHAEIVRLRAPDFRPQAMEFSLANVLGGDDPIALQPFDTVRILGRYELDPPNVSINGEVLRPGEYPMSQGLKVSDLIRLAGGFKRSALQQNADLASYTIQNGQKVVTQHALVDLKDALSDDPKDDVALKPGDVLTIRQLTGWTDIGASVQLSGEVRYPGNYGIQESEKLSSLIQRAGGFREDAYPNGAVLEREQVREFDEKSRSSLIHRVESAEPAVRGGTSQDDKDTAAAFLQQQHQILTTLKSEPANGRLVIKISSQISKWKNTAADIELRAGDVLIVPKRPSFVLVSGEANSPSALTYTPGKNAGWYLARAGGVSEFGNKKEIFVIRANGSVVGRQGTSDWWKGNVLSTLLQPGDTVIVPEKIMGQSVFWRNVLSTAQLGTSLAIAARVATSF